MTYLKEKTTGANKVLPKEGLNDFDWTLVQGSVLGALMYFCANNRSLRQYPKR